MGAGGLGAGESGVAPCKPRLSIWFSICRRVLTFRGRLEGYYFSLLIIELPLFEAEKDDPHVRSRRAEAMLLISSQLACNSSRCSVLAFHRRKGQRCGDHHNQFS
jgi:hypothetical protein